MRGHRTTLRRRILATVAIASVAVAGAACEADPDEPVVVGGHDSPDPAEVEEQAGPEVTVTGEVTDVISPQVFELVREDGGGDILVVGSETSGVSEGQVVEVTGAVRQVAPGLFQQTGFDPDPSFYADLDLADEADFLERFEGRNTIAAGTVDVVEAD